MALFSSKSPHTKKYYALSAEVASAEKVIKNQDSRLKRAISIKNKTKQKVKCEAEIKKLNSELLELNRERMDLYANIKHLIPYSDLL